MATGFWQLFYLFYFILSLFLFFFPPPAFLNGNAQGLATVSYSDGTPLLPPLKHIFLSLKKKKRGQSSVFFLLLPPSLHFSALKAHILLRCHFKKTGLCRDGVQLFHSGAFTAAFHSNWVHGFSKECHLTLAASSPAGGDEGKEQVNLPFGFFLSFFFLFLKVPI